MQKMGVGEFAKLMDVSIRTLQYYDHIDLLKPSSYSEGGRRYYTAKESVLLIQINSLKQMGLSLEQIKNQLLDGNNVEEIKTLLHRQKISLHTQIEDLKIAYTALCHLEEEVHEIEDLDYENYMDILNKILMNPFNYWVFQSMDDTLNEHIQKHFENNPQSGIDIYNKWNVLSDKVLGLMKQNIPPDSKEATQIAKSWWDMVMRFTNGDLTLLPHLEKFNNSKSKWNKKQANRQKQIDQYIELALTFYMEQFQNIELKE